MTIEELIGLSANDLEAFLNDEKKLLEWAAPFLHVTRPEQQKELPMTKEEKPKAKPDYKKQQEEKARELCKQYGIDLK